MPASVGQIGPMMTTHSAGKMKIASGKISFSWSCAAFSSARCRRSDAHLLGLHRQHLGHADTELLRLQDRADEVVQVGHLCPQHHVLQRVAARATDPHLGQHARELGRQRVVAFFDQALNRRVEAEAGLDA